MKCYSATKNEIIPFATTWMDLKVIIVQFSSVTQPCPTLCDPMNRRTPGLPVHHQLPEFAQTHVHWVGDAIQPAHPLSSPSPPTFNLSQHQSFPMSQFFTSGGQSIGVSASTSVLPMNASKWSKSNRERKYDTILLICGIFLKNANELTNKRETDFQTWKTNL